jgi:transglutaminase-like putative cysteine protease
MRRRTLIAILGWFSGLLTLSAQTDLSVSAIPDSLKKNANTVTRFDNETIDIYSLKSGVRKDSYAITVLDEKGESHASFLLTGDVFNVLKSFSAKLYDAQGKLLKKYGKSDLQTSEYSSALATDNKSYYFSCDAPSIPFTIRYDYEVSMNNGILNFGYFFPMDSYYHSVQSYVYLLRLPETVIPRIKSFNHIQEPGISTASGITTYFWKVENQKAIESEPLDPPLDDYVPYVSIAPNDFIYDGTPGSVSSWSELGKWSYNLTVGRDVIPEELKAKLLDLTKNAKTDKEKVQILYNYMGETTRYVSIQLGIGGYQPMAASEVYKMGFGDCKALTNYLKAMLSVLGIHSEYCTIRFDEDKKELLNDFPDFLQMNHAILMVPLPNEKLWLECTNTKVPFGFVHNGIAGHDVLVCKPEGGEIQKLPDYADSLNLEQNVAYVNLLADGSASVKMQKDCRVKIYDTNDWFLLAKASDQTDNLREDIHLPNVELGSFHTTENKKALPSYSVDFSWKTSLYGSKTGNRLFLPVNIFRSGYEQLRKPNRIHDICIEMGYRDADSIFVQIPESFEVEALPPTVLVVSRFGSFTAKVVLEGNQLKIVQVADVFTGNYKDSEYQEFIAFFNKITTAYKGKIILRKKSV